jgi:hypothetical protein
MPQLLKNETLRRLNTSLQALRLALWLLATPKSIGYESQPTDGAIEIGLIGTAADLGIAACLYEIHGISGIIRKESGFYITAAEGLSRFKHTLTSAIPRLSTITNGVDDPNVHLKKLHDACSSFSVLFTARAAALHGGAGVSNDVAFFAVHAVVNFLNLLAESPKWKAYLKEIPLIQQMPKDRTLIAQELAAAISSKDKQTTTSALSGIFLVLPELTKSEPDWLKALNRVQIAPRKQDITVLIKSLKEAKVGDIFKVGKGSTGTPVKIDPHNPLAIPIYPAAMKKKYENLNDQWAGYIATANAELDKDILSLPPIEAIFRFSAVGIENIGLPEEEITNGLSAHSVWPFIASALNYQGTKGPCFFAARFLKKTEVGQLMALLKKAAPLGGRLNKAIKGYEPLLIAAIEQKHTSKSNILAKQLSEAVFSREERRDGLVESMKIRNHKEKGTLKEAYKSLLDLIVKSDSLASSITQIAEEKIDFESYKISILRNLIDAATEKEDLSALVIIENNKNYRSLATTARKAIQQIDYAHYGPQVED